eukprot:7489870-Prorocentrum_lima.AAC.1
MHTRVPRVRVSKENSPQQGAFTAHEMWVCHRMVSRWEGRPAGKKRGHHEGTPGDAKAWLEAR